MPIKENKSYGGNSYIGFKTLFVNSKETQRLSQKYGLQPVNVIKRADEFSSVWPPPPENLTNEDIKNSDLFRYNLGKFFWRTPETTS